ncbi:MAG: hypothetical protein ACRDZY_13180 [Acidimicrobiales bacterium]
MSLNEQLQHQPASGRRGMAIVLSVLAVLAVGGYLGFRAIDSRPSQPALAGPTVTTSTPPATTSTPAATTSAPATTALAAINLQLADLPGWTLSSDSSDDSAQNAADQRAMGTCMGVPGLGTGQGHSYPSPNFDRGNLEVSSEVDSYHSQADVERDTAMINNSKAKPCFEKTLRHDLASSLPASVKMSNLAISITPRRATDPSNVAGEFTMTATVTGNGRTVTVYVSETDMVGSLSEVNVNITGTGQPVPAALRADLVRTVAARAAKA